jgi:hypothetical protein
MNITENQITAEGRAVRECGRPVTLNPYYDNPRHDWWLAGWHQAASAQPRPTPGIALIGPGLFVRTRPRNFR